MYWYIGGILVVAGVVNAVRGEVAMGLVAALAGLVVLVWPALRWKQELTITTDGFTWTRPVLGTRTVKADEVKKVTLVTHHTRMGVHQEVKVDLKDGQTVSIVGVEQAEQAANLIHGMAGGRELPVQTGGSGWKAPGARA